MHHFFSYHNVKRDISFVHNTYYSGATSRYITYIVELIKLSVMEKEILIKGAGVLYSEIILTALQEYRKQCNAYGNYGRGDAVGLIIDAIKFDHSEYEDTHVQLIRKRSNNELVGIAASWLDARLFMKDARLPFSEHYILRYKVTKYK